MSKKKETELEIFKKSIWNKAIELGFKSVLDDGTVSKCDYIFSFGLNNCISIDFMYQEHLTLDIETHKNIIEIRKIESPEDLENLFNAICPEKYRLPFD